MKSLMRHVDWLSRRRLLGLPLDVLAALAGLTTASAGLLRLPMPRVLPLAEPPLPHRQAGTTSRNREPGVLRGGTRAGAS